MDAIKRIAAFYLALTALAVFFNLILTPVYHDGSPDYPVWEIINYFMAAGPSCPCRELPAKTRCGKCSSAADRVWANVFPPYLVMLFVGSISPSTAETRTVTPPVYH